MGCVTPVLIRNDSLDAIKSDPEFIDNLIRACVPTQSSTVSANGYCSAVEVMGTKHEDIPRLLVVMGNTMVELNQYTDDVIEDSSGFYKMCAKFARRESAAILKKMQAVK